MALKFAYQKVAVVLGIKTLGGQTVVIASDTRWLSKISKINKSINK